MAASTVDILPSHHIIVVGRRDAHAPVCEYVMNLLHSKRDFADVIEVTDLKIGRRVAWITQVGSVEWHEPFKAENFL